MLVTTIQVDFEYEDNRGSLKQLFHDGWRQVNVIKSFAGHTRGGHFHKNNKEAFYIIGGSVNLLLERGDITERHSFEAGDMFQIEPYVIHSFEFPEDTVLVSMYDLGVEEEDGTKDIYAL